MGRSVSNSIAKLILCSLLSLHLGTGNLMAEANVTFDDIATDPESGLNYLRTPSPTSDDFDFLKQTVPLFTFATVAQTPIKARGAPGVAVLDYDLDGDLDIYVTNGPGKANSLYANQLTESGQVRFTDRASAAGVDATDQDSTGVCFGDIDNDGDHDLYVLGNREPNRLFENLGNGAFADITLAAGVGAGVFTTTSCSFGDIDNDGLLDLVVANAYTDWSHPLGIVGDDAFPFMEPNQLFRNLGSNTFADVSESSGIRENRGFAPGDEGRAALTWAIAMVDMDRDGDVDVVMADDQGSAPFVGPDAQVRGILHLFENDGTGQFTDVSLSAGLGQPGGWMGLAFGDLDCNGTVDFFASNFGDFVGLFNSGGQAPVGIFPSRWYLGNGSGGFTAPDLGSLVSTPFGWGVGLVDVENDGDQDILYHGGMDLALSIEASNAGVLLINDGSCSGTFRRETAPFAGGTDHLRRNVQGVAIGDLDGNGFQDIVSVSNFDMPAPIPLLPIPNNTTAFPEAAQVPTFAPGPSLGTFVFTGLTYPDGTLSVEMNSGNENRWLQVRLVGSAGITTDGRANRDGIGATVEVSSGGHGQGLSSARPVVGGSSYASQHSLTASFGLGSHRWATVDVQWPGGTRNRLYAVRHGRELIFPEIPCSYDDPSLSFRDYKRCVRRALRELSDEGVIGRRERARFFASAVYAYLIER